jgi:hypothetical protein
MRPWSVDKLIISRATTFIEEPLRPDGYPDYIEALNARMSEGVTPENNAAVLLMRAIGPKDIGYEIQTEFFSRLKMAPLSATGDYFEEWGEFSKRIPAAEQPQAIAETASGADAATEMYDEAAQRPWGRTEFPQVAEWLDSNERELELVVAASKRSRFYAPAISASDPPTMFSVLLPIVNNVRVVSLALVARAMLRLQEGQVDGAWDDLMACRRLARLVGQGNFLVELLVCYAIEDLGITGQGNLLAGANLSAEQCAAMRKELDELGRLPSIADRFDFGERMGVLDIVLTVAREGPRALSGITGDTANNPLMQFMMRGGDWNVALVMMNEWMDRHVAAARIEDPKVRTAEAARIDADLRATVAEVRQPMEMASSFMSRSAASNRNAKILAGLTLPALTTVFQAEARTRTRQEVLRVGIALAHYKAEHGEYPENVDVLVPKYLSVVPTDLFAGTPLVYKTRANGYLLYSLGANQVDDGGKSYDANGDDLVIEVPRKEKRRDPMGIEGMGNGE